MSTFIPQQCTERETNGDEDCTWASGVMFNNAAHGRNVVPSTRTEYEALRVAGGDGPAENPGDGSNLGQLETGIKRRYGWDPHRVGPPGGAHVSFETFWRSLKPGMGAAVQGWMGVFDRNGHWRRWDPQFGGAHCSYVQRRDSRDRVWWMNPSAPNSYAGEWMSKADLKRYYDGFAGGYLVVEVGALAPPDTGTGDDDVLKAIAVYQYPSIATSRVATKLYSECSEAGVLGGKSYDIPAGHTKRAIGPVTDKVARIAHDRDDAVDGKSGLYGRTADWNIRESP